MKRLEIISLRTSGSCEQEARKYMKKFCKLMKKHTSSSASFYVHASIPGDLAVVITSAAEQGKDPGIDLGVCMADVMKQFGLVDHTCWILADNQ
ncbi:MAG: hypothetical protein A4E71_02530 [Smithella sp. PtaU1.Bin162]|nr:MAG: hypothetical protein A4E71_02530 [Smithella sp. PtaU1.Bin162]